MEESGKLVEDYGKQVPFPRLNCSSRLRWKIMEDWWKMMEDRFDFQNLLLVQDKYVRLGKIGQR